MKQFLIPTYKGWDVYEERLCNQCNSTHPVKANHIYGGSEKKMRDLGYEIKGREAVDNITCEEEDEEDEKE